MSFSTKRFRYTRFLYPTKKHGPIRKPKVTRLNIHNNYQRVRSLHDGKLFFRFRGAPQLPKAASIYAKKYNNAFLWFPKDSTAQSSAPLRLQGFHKPSQLFNENTALQLNFLPNVSASTRSNGQKHSSYSSLSPLPHLHLLNSTSLDTYNLSLHPVFRESLPVDGYRTWVIFSQLSQNLKFKQEVLRNNVIRLGRTREVFQFFNYHSLADLQLDKRIKILIPDLNVTPRGSFWRSTRWVIDQPRVSTSPTLKVRRTKVPARLQDSLAKALLSRAPSKRLRRRPAGFLRALFRHLKFRTGRSRWLLSRLKRRGRRAKRRVLRRKKGVFKQLRRLPFFLIARRRRNQKSNKFSQSVLNSPKRRATKRHPAAFYSEHERARSQLTLLSRSPLHNKSGKLKFLHLAKGTTALSVYSAQSHLISEIGLSKNWTRSPSPSACSTWALGLDLISTAWLEPLFFKYLISKIAKGNFQPNTLHNITMRLQSQLQSYVFGSGIGAGSRSNLWAAPSSNYVIRKKLLRSTSYSLFSLDLSLWYYKSLTSFIEDCSGRKVALRIGPFLEGALTFEDRAYCSLWGIRVTGFQRMLGHKIFAHEALMLVALSFRLKDPTFLANWIRGMLKRLSFWKYRLIFRYLKFLFQHIFRPNFRVFGFRGLKLRLKGKISVAGNARTRTLFYKVGDVSHSKMDNKVAYDLSYVNTFTGIMGFKLWFFY